MLVSGWLPAGIDLTHAIAPQQVPKDWLDNSFAFTNHIVSSTSLQALVHLIIERLPGGVGKGLVVRVG